MAIPLAAGTTCDIYRAGRSPPAAPDVAAVPASLTSRFTRGLEVGEGDEIEKKFTHTLLVDLATDIRDSYDAGTVGGSADTIFIPDQDGTPFKVVFVQRQGRRTPSDCKKVFLSRRLLP